MIESPVVGLRQIWVHPILSLESCVTMKKSLCVSDPPFSYLKAKLPSIYQASRGMVHGSGVGGKHITAAQDAIVALVLNPLVTTSLP